MFPFARRHHHKTWTVWLLTLFGLPHQGFHDKVLEDCDTVLSLNASNCKALYRKSKALSDLGRYKEAYDAVAKCSLAVPQVWNLCFSSFIYIITILLILCREMALKSYIFQPATHLLQLGIIAHKTSVLTEYKLELFCLFVFTVSKYSPPLIVYSHFFQDEHVIKLTQELAQKLGFKIRKAYVRTEVRWSSLHKVFVLFCSLESVLVLN